MDGVEVDPSNYDVTEGSTIITFKKDFISGLNNGNHTIRVAVSDGSATTSFNMVTGSPATGDNIFFYLSLLLMSIGGLFLIRKMKAKKTL